MLVYGTYPKKGPPKRPCFRFYENWTGVEYAAAVLMMQEGRTADGLKVFKAVRERFDGKKRNPFDEPECGHHYARAMASWGAVLELTGFHYSGVEKSLRFAAAGAPACYFWSNGYAWGTCRQKPAKAQTTVLLKVLHGKLELKRLTLEGFGTLELLKTKTLSKGRTESFDVKRG